MRSSLIRACRARSRAQTAVTRWFSSWGPIALTTVEASKDRTLLRVTHGETVVLASMRQSSDGRAASRGTLAVEYKERSFARTGLEAGCGESRHDNRAATLMTDRERCVASDIYHVLESSMVGVPPRRRVSVKLTVLSAGREDPELVAINAASALLQASGIPWYGPFGAVRVLFSSRPSPPRATMLRDGNDSSEETVDGSMVVVCDRHGHVLFMRGFASTPKSSKDIEIGLGVAQGHIGAHLATTTRAMTRAKREVEAGGSIIVAGAEPAAGRRIHDQIEQYLKPRIASLRRKPLGDMFDYIESTVKPEIVEGLQQQGRFRHEASRIRGSGCVTVQDIDHTINGVLQDLLRRDKGCQQGSRDCCAENRAPSTASVFELGHLPVAHASSSYTSSGVIVESALRCVRHAADETIAGLPKARASSVFLTCPHGKFSGVESINVGNGNEHLEDIQRASFVREVVSMMLPPPDVLPFAVQISTEVLRTNARGVGSLAAAVNGMSHALTGSLLANTSGGAKNHVNKNSYQVVPWTAAAVGVSYRYPDGMLDGEEYELTMGEHGWYTPLGTTGYDVQRDPNGLSSLVTDAEVTVVGPRGRHSISAWMVQCYAPTRISSEAIQRCIEAAMPVREMRQKEIPRVRIRRRAPVFGALSVSTAVMPKLLAEKSASLRKIEESTGGIIHVKEPGLLSLFAPSMDAYEALEDQICTASGAFLVPNRVYKATVTAVKDFGAFVLLPRCDVEAMLHISEVSNERIASIQDELAVGDVIHVVFLGEDSQGGLRVSKRKVTTDGRQSRDKT